MAEQISESGSPALIFPLNYDCMFEVFQWLRFNDCMNLADAFDGLQSVADWIYKRKFNKFTFDFEEPIDRVLYHAGPTLTSLTLIMDKHNFTENDLIEIRDTCTELKSLTLKGFDRKTIKHNPFCSANDKLEILSLSQCFFANDTDFFGTLKNLKSLNVRRCLNIHTVAVRKCFKNNPGIKSFTTDNQYMLYPRLLHLLPNLERLSLHCTILQQRFELDYLSKFKSLRHFTLHCWDQNVNDILTDLAKVNILEELVLNDVTIDENTFDIIKTLDNLKLLVLKTYNCEFPAADDLPTKLKALKLEGFHLIEDDMTSLVEQLEDLQDIHLANCELDSHGFFAGDFKLMSDFIVDELIEHADRPLNITLTFFGNDYPLLKTTVAAGNLWIYNYLENPNVFEILYPGIDDLSQFSKMFNL